MVNERTERLHEGEDAPHLLEAATRLQAIMGDPSERGAVAGDGTDRSEYEFIHSALNLSVGASLNLLLDIEFRGPTVGICPWCLEAGRHKPSCHLAIHIRKLRTDAGTAFRRVLGVMPRT